MRNLTRRFLALLALTFCCLIFTEARADNYEITSGSISTGYVSSTYNFAGAGISVTGATYDGLISPQFCFPCTSGTTIRTGGTYEGGRGTVMLNGVTYSNVYFAGRLVVSGPDMVLPDGEGFDPITITVPFELSGQFIGDTLDPFVGNGSNVVFSTMLTGHGFATFRFTYGQIPSVYSYQSATYNFQPTSVPEPATLVLLGTGLTGVVAGVRRRRKKT